MSQNWKNLQLVNQALIAVNNGMSLRQAAAKFGCSKSTIHIYLKRGKLEAKRQQEEVTLTISEEERLGNWLIYCYYLGYFQVSQSNLSREAQNLLKTRGSKGKFNREWCKQFQQRQKYVQSSLDFYEKYRDLDSKFENKWMGSLIIYCRNQNLFHCLQDPRYMYYCCQLTITDNLKLIMTYSAQGKTAPPLIINVNVDERMDFEELVMPHDWFKYNCQKLENGNDQDNALPYYIEQVFKPYLIQENLNKPLLLFNKYQSSPIALAFFELCTEHHIYPVNSLMSAFKLDQSLQMEISSRMKNVTDKKTSAYVDLMKNIILFKLTKQRMCESFRESGIYPLAVGKMNIKELPRLQMSSIVETGNTAQPQPTQPEIKTELEIDDEKSILCQSAEPSKTITTSLKRKHDGSNDVTASCELKNTGNSNTVPTPEKRVCSISLNVDKYDQMAFQNFCLDDNDIAVCNEPLQTDDPLCEIKVEDF